MRFVFLMLVMLIVLCFVAVVRGAERPNIVVILADDMGYADAGFMGGRVIRTPNLDELAKGGMVTEAHYVQPVCSPTRASLLTGRYVAHTGVYNVVRPGGKWGLPLAERTLADALRQAGYETAIVGKWHLGAADEAYLPLRRGFDHQYGNYQGALDYFTHVRDGVVDWHRDDRPCDDKGYTTFLDADEAVRLIKSKADKPLFLYLPFNAVHGPLDAPPEYLKQYENLQGVRRRYAAALTAMDDAVGRVVTALKEKGIYENTLIVFSSDNGGPRPGVVTDNGILRAGKGTIYEGGVRACSFVSWPGHVPAGRTSEPVHVIDWYPTLITLAGGSLEQPLPIDGKDIWPVLTRGAKSPHDVLLFSGLSPDRVAVRSGNWKLLVRASDRDAEDAPGTEDAADKVELFDLATDPGEKKDVAAQNPEKVKELRTRLDELRKTFVRPLGPAALEAKRGVERARPRRRGGVKV